MIIIRSIIVKCKVYSYTTKLCLSQVFLFYRYIKILIRLETFHRKEQEREGGGGEGGDDDAGRKLSRTSVNKRAKLTFQFLRLVAK